MSPKTLAPRDKVESRRIEHIHNDRSLSYHLKPNNQDGYVFPPMMPTFRASTVGPLEHIFTDGKTWFSLGRYAIDHLTDLHRCIKDIRADTESSQVSARANCLKKMIEDTSPPAIKVFRKSAGEIELSELFSKLQGLTRRGGEEQMVTKETTIPRLKEETTSITNPLPQFSFRFSSNIDELKKREINGTLFNSRRPRIMNPDKSPPTNGETNFPGHYSLETVSSTPSIFPITMNPNHAQQPPLINRNAFILFKDNDDISTLDLNKSRTRTPSALSHPTGKTSPEIATAASFFETEFSRSEFLARWTEKLRRRESEMLRREGLLAQREMTIALEELRMEVKGLGYRIGDKETGDDLGARRDKAAMAKEVDVGNSREAPAEPSLE